MACYDKSVDVWTEEELAARGFKIEGSVAAKPAPVKKAVVKQSVAAQRREAKELFVDEEAFTDAVIKLAKEKYGWNVFHIRRSKHKAVVTEKGLPDLVCWHRSWGQFFVAELKMPGGTSTADQLACCVALAMAGVEVYVWYPKDLEFIERRFASQSPVRVATDAVSALGQILPLLTGSEYPESNQ